MELKNLSLYLTIGGIAVTFISGYAVLNAQTNTTKEEVKDLKKEVATVKEATDKNETRQEAVKEKVGDMDKKIDKIVDLLVAQAKEKKR